ncbi:MAG: hypothetical protein WC960_07835 [Bacteroidales bacterium]
MGRVENKSNSKEKKRDEDLRNIEKNEEREVEQRGEAEELEEKKELRDNILNGLDIALHKLITEKKKSNSELALSNRGKVIKVKANEL